MKTEIAHAAIIRGVVTLLYYYYKPFVIEDLRRRHIFSEALIFNLKKIFLYLNKEHKKIIKIVYKIKDFISNLLKSNIYLYLMSCYTRELECIYGRRGRTGSHTLGSCDALCGDLQWCVRCIYVYIRGDND